MGYRLLAWWAEGLTQEGGGRGQAKGKHEEGVKRLGQRRMASMAEGDEGMKVGDKDHPKEDRAPNQSQQRLERLGTGAPTEVGGNGQVGVCAGDRSNRDAQ